MSQFYKLQCLPISLAVYCSYLAMCIKLAMSKTELTVKGGNMEAQW